MVKSSIKGDSGNKTRLIDEIFSQLTRTQRKRLQKEIQELTEAKSEGHSWLWWAARTLLYLIAFVGGATFVQVRNSFPNVTPTRFDSKYPYAFPFLVSNDQSLVTFYNAKASIDSFSPDLEHNKEGTLQVLGVEIGNTFSQSFDLRPGDKVPLQFSDYTVAGLPPHLPQHLTARVSIAYEIHFVPYIHFLAWHRVRKFRFDMVKDSNGTPFWIPAYMAQ